MAGNCSPKLPTTVTISSSEIVNFQFAMKDVQVLLELHDKETERLRGRPDRSLEVFKRAAVILSITAWETFIEDTIRSVAMERIQGARSPSDIPKTFNSVAASWLQIGTPQPPALADWTGDGWKSKLIDYLEKQIADLNTPNAENIKQLSQRYLDLDITTSWRWRATSNDSAKRRLDDLIFTRGALVHRGPQMLEAAAVKRAHVMEAIALLPKLAECTEKMLGREPRRASIEEAQKA
jgi:hypothetical protein